MNARNALRTMTPTIAAASTVVPLTAARIAATHNTSASGWVNWATR
ncbi:MAG: hypothetical protein WCA46_10155 [Actinocatenispora sp.]